MRERLQVAVEEFTSPSPICVSETEQVGVIMKLMEEHKCRHMPVISRHDKVVGIISDRDIYKACCKNTDSCNLSASDLMTRDVFRVKKNENIDKVVFAMSDRKISSALVEDETEFFGIFTSTDALNALLEIIRGDLDC